MATTYTTQAMKPVALQDAHLDIVAEYGLEGSSVTVLYGGTVVTSSGYLVEGAHPSTVILGFALQKGANNTAHAAFKFLPCVPGTGVVANLLASSAAAHTFAAADMFTPYQIAYSATFDGTNPGWYIEATASSQVCRIVSLYGGEPMATEPTGLIQIGDINIRTKAIIMSTAIVAATGLM